MSRSSGKKAFTLIEILVAMAIIVTIVSMVYASHFATSKSAALYNTRLSLSQDLRKVLHRMALQIRCAYGGPADAFSSTAAPVSDAARIGADNPVNYFMADPAERRGETLRLITTKSSFSDGKKSDGLFEVAYRFDGNRGVLLLHQAGFPALTENDDVQKGNWMPVAENIEGLELEFFDADRWLDKWDWKDRGVLPRAARIGITGRDENGRTIRYETVAHLSCWKNQRTGLNVER